MISRTEWFPASINESLTSQVQKIRQRMIDKKGRDGDKNPKYAGPLERIIKLIQKLERINAVVKNNGVNGFFELNEDDSVKTNDLHEPIFIEELNGSDIDKIFYDIKAELTSLSKASKKLFCDATGARLISDFKNICSEFNIVHQLKKSEITNLKMSQHASSISPVLESASASSIVSSGPALVSSAAASEPASVSPAASSEPALSATSRIERASSVAASSMSFAMEMEPPALKIIPRATSQSSKGSASFFSSSSSSSSSSSASSRPNEIAAIIYRTPYEEKRDESVHELAQKLEEIESFKNILKQLEELETYIIKSRAEINVFTAHVIWQFKQNVNSDESASEIITKIFKNANAQLRTLEKKVSEIKKEISEESVNNELFVGLIKEAKEDKVLIKASIKALMHASVESRDKGFRTQAEVILINCIKNVFNRQYSWADQVKGIKILLADKQMDQSRKLDVIFKTAPVLLNTKQGWLFGATNLVYSPDAREFLGVLKLNDNLTKANDENYIRALTKISEKLKELYKSPSQILLGK